MNVPPAYDIRPAASDGDLRGILALQAENHRSALGPEERRAQGFVSLRHDLALLREMNTPWAHAVASPAGGDGVVAYALVMLPRFRSRLPLLDPMFERLDGLAWRGRPIAAWRWCVMGQVCVARAHRGRGLVDGLYADLRRRLAAGFDLMITEIDRENPRSLRAHEKAGFEVMDEYRAEGGSAWVVVGLDLRGDGA
jgi:ribosomal protein S18 acetylase RimI-like enzyme